MTPPSASGWLSPRRHLVGFGADGKTITGADIDADYQKEYGWYAAQGAAMQAGVFAAEALLLLGLMLGALRVASWVIDGFASGRNAKERLGAGTSLKENAAP